jgi:Protein of unknown function (DUF3551)
MMRMPIIALFLIAAALLGETQVSNAQSAYSYPWCAVYFGGNDGLGGAMSCYYTSWEQCRTTMLGIGGNCVESPYYHAQSTPLPNRSLVKTRHHRHARTVGGRE